jgi:ketosteroid isomerase-like protein
LRRDAEWADLATAGTDVEKVLSYWSEDAVLIFPGQPVLEGKAAIRAYVTASFNTPGFKIHWSRKDLYSLLTANSHTCEARTSSPCLDQMAVP